MHRFDKKLRLSPAYDYFKISPREKTKLIRKSIIRKRKGNDNISRSVDIIKMR